MENKNMVTIQAVFNLDDPYQYKLYNFVIPPGTTNKSDAAKRVFIRDMERQTINFSPVVNSNDNDKKFMEGFI